MSSGNLYERLFKQWVSIGQMLIEEKRNPHEVSFALQQVIEVRKNIPFLLLDWRNFYSRVFGCSFDFSDLAVPPYQPGVEKLLVVARGFTEKILYDKCNELFPCHREDSPDLHSDRTAHEKTYAVWVRDRQEADKELRNLSFHQVRIQKIRTETLEERELHELKVFDEKRKHLDKKYWTLCSGSQCNKSAMIPSAYWYDGIFRIRHYDFTDAHVLLGPRLVVA